MHTSAVWIALLFVAGGPVEPEAPLSLADLEGMALKGNPTLAQAAAAIDAAHGAAQQAGLYPNPTIGYIGDQIGIAGTAGEIQGGFVQQTIVTAHKLKLSRAKYEQRAVEAELIALAQQFRVLNSVRMRYYEILATQQLIALHQEMLNNAEESLRTHREMLNNGQANQAEVLLAEVAATQARMDFVAIQNHYRARWEALMALVGTPEICPRTLLGTLEPLGPCLEWEKELERLLHESPEVQYAEAHVKTDVITLKREQVEPIPNLQLQADTGKNFETHNTVAGCQIGVVIPLWDRNQGTIKQAEADLMRSHAEVERVRLSLRRRLAEAFDIYLTAGEMARTFRDQTVPKITQAYEIQRDMYEKRRLAWPGVVEMQHRLLEVKMTYVQKMLEWRMAEVRICGLLLVDGLTEPPPPTPGGHMDATPRPR